MSRIYENITETIGNTPLVKVRKVIDSSATVLAKVESFNPMWSVKDRIAKYIIEQAEKVPPFIVELQGKVLEEAPAKPAQVLNDFQEALGQLPSLKGKSIEMEMARFSRNNQFGHFDFTLLVKISVEKAPSL